MTQLSDSYDVIIVGGSYAGLSAAMALGRARRKVLIIDAGEPCNAQTPHSHNFLTQDGKTPREISAIAKAQVMEYPTVDFTGDFVSAAGKENETFVVSTQLGRRYNSRKLLLATGIKDMLPPIEGLQECWGISVLHCPYCHGYEVRDLKLGILANGESAVELTKLIFNWSQHLVVFTNGPSTLTAMHHTELEKLDVPIHEARVKRAIHRGGQIEALELEDGKQITLSAMFTRAPFTQHSPIASQLGCDHAESGLLKADEFGKTNVPGLFAAGDCFLPQRSVGIAVASGTKAGVWINKELIDAGYFASTVRTQLMKPAAFQHKLA